MNFVSRITAGRGMVSRSDRTTRSGSASTISALPSMTSRSARRMGTMVSGSNDAFSARQPTITHTSRRCVCELPQDPSMRECELTLRHPRLDEAGSRRVLDTSQPSKVPIREQDGSSIARTHADSHAGADRSRHRGQPAVRIGELALGDRHEALLDRAGDRARASRLRSRSGRPSGSA